MKRSLLLQNQGEGVFGAPLRFKGPRTRPIPLCSLIIMTPLLAPGLCTMLLDFFALLSPRCPLIPVRKLIESNDDVKVGVNIKLLPPSPSAELDLNLFSFPSENLSGLQVCSASEKMPTLVPRKEAAPHPNESSRLVYLRYAGSPTPPRSALSTESGLNGNVAVGCAICGIVLKITPESGDISGVRT